MWDIQDFYSNMAPTPSKYWRAARLQICQLALSSRRNYPQALEYFYTGYKLYRITIRKHNLYFNLNLDVGYKSFQNRVNRTQMM